MGDNNRNNSAGASVLTIVQIIFVIVHYSDPCLKNSQRECNTTLGYWKWWEVWMPYLILAGLIGLLCVCGGSVLCCVVQGEKREIAREQINYTQRVIQQPPQPVTIVDSIRQNTPSPSKKIPNENTFLTEIIVK